MIAFNGLKYYLLKSAVLLSGKKDIEHGDFYKTTSEKLGFKEYSISQLISSDVKASLNCSDTVALIEFINEIRVEIFGIKLNSISLVGPGVLEIDKTFAAFQYLLFFGKLSEKNSVCVPVFIDLINQLLGYVEKAKSLNQPQAQYALTEDELKKLEAYLGTEVLSKDNAVIKKAYYKTALNLHPDKNPGKESEFKEMIDLYTRWLEHRPFKASAATSIPKVMDELKIINIWIKAFTTHKTTDIYGAVYKYIALLADYIPTNNVEDINKRIIKHKKNLVNAIWYKNKILQLLTVFNIGVNSTAFIGFLTDSLSTTIKVIKEEPYFYLACCGAQAILILGFSAYDVWQEKKSIKEIQEAYRGEERFTEMFYLPSLVFPSAMILSSLVANPSKIILPTEWPIGIYISGVTLLTNVLILNYKNIRFDVGSKDFGYVDM